MLFYLVVLWEEIFEFVAGSWNWWKQFTPYVVSAKKKVMEGCEGIAFTNDDISDEQHVFSPARRHISSHCQPSSPLPLSHKHLRAAAGVNGVHCSSSQTG